MNRFQNKYFNEKFVDLLILSEKRKKTSVLSYSLVSAYCAHFHFLSEPEPGFILFHFILFFVCDRLDCNASRTGTGIGREQQFCGLRGFVGSTCKITSVINHLECVSLRKSKIGFLNLKESENRFCVSLLNRSIQDLSNHGASKEPKNPHWELFSGW